MTNEQYLHATALETLCLTLRFEYIDVLNGVQNLLETQQNLDEFVVWNNTFCEDKDVFLLEMNFYDHVLVYLYEKLFTNLKSDGISVDLPDIASLDTPEVFTKVKEWEASQTLAKYVKQIPYKSRTVLDYWFYIRLCTSKD